MIKEKLSVLKNIPSRVFLVFFVASFVISIGALRHNNQTMIELREKVFAADRDNGDVNAALNDLRRYVYSHMNTNLASGGNSIKPPIQLEHTYKRLQAQQDAAIRSGQVPPPIPAALYQFDFVSPTWSPDLAGWSLAASFLFLAAFILSFVIRRLTRVSSR